MARRKEKNVFAWAEKFVCHGKSSFYFFSTLLLLAKSPTDIIFSSFFRLMGLNKSIIACWPVWRIIFYHKISNHLPVYDNGIWRCLISVSTRFLLATSTEKGKNMTSELQSSPYSRCFSPLFVQDRELWRRASRRIARTKRAEQHAGQLRIHINHQDLRIDPELIFFLF